MQYYEDLVVGKVTKFGHYEVTREEVIDFASKYDPQPFHLDDAAAAATHFGRLSASGWHTAAMVMSMTVANLTANRQAGLGSPGVDELRWIKPVYPGDTLRCENTLLEKRRSKTKPEMGIIKGQTHVYNQNDELVMSFKALGLVATRDPAGTG
ncbi:MAG: MaoC family dehydratase [Novosphingobium sp.]|nr:MaoC family dehydratase [Novosphingobium sp.]